MTRAPTYPIHRNRRNSISIRFSVRSIRFSRCGLRACRPSPSRLARARRQGDTLPPSRGRVKGELALHRASTTRGGRAARGEGRPAGRAGGRREARERPAPVQGRAPVRGRGSLRGLGSLHACPNTRSKPPQKKKSPRVGPGARRGAARRRPLWREKAPCASEAPYPPAAWRCSTFGDGGLNCRVRNGIG